MSILNPIMLSPEKNQNHPENIQRLSPQHEDRTEEKVEYEPKFKQHQEDLKYLFAIDVHDEASLSNPFLKNEMYEKVLDDFKEGKPFALDYMFEEGLLTRDDLESRGIKNLKEQALKILGTFKDPRFTSIKKLFINTGIITEEEASRLAHSFSK